MPNTLHAYESRYPGCSSEPPWWPSDKKVTYREVDRMSPVTMRGGHLKMLIATRGKNTLAYWSLLLQVWEVVLP